MVSQARGMILLWGRAEDAPLRDVRGALATAGADTFLLNDLNLLTATLRLDAGGPASGDLRVDGQAIDLAEVAGAYFRPGGFEPIMQRVELARRADMARRMAALSSGLWAWADVTPALVLNRPGLMASNASKPLQARMLAAMGFRVPETLVTTDAEAARAFAAQHRTIIYKSISAVRSIVARLDELDPERLAQLANCPVQFQAYVPGIDVRVHIVGDDVFACEIQSDADDYRYSGRSGLTTRMVSTTLPTAVEERCRRVSATFGLPLCGIDLRRTPDDRWVAFEVNPSPGFSYFAEATGQPIAEAIAVLLQRADEAA